MIVKQTAKVVQVNSRTQGVKQGMRSILSQILDLEDMIEEVTFLQARHDIHRELRKLHRSVKHYRELGEDIGLRFEEMSNWANDVLEPSPTQVSKMAYMNLLSALTKLEYQFRELLRTNVQPNFAYSR